MFRNMLPPTILCLAFLIVCPAQENKKISSVERQSEVYKEIERLETEWNIINEVSDSEGKQRMLAEDSYHIGNDGRLYNKAQDVEIQRAAREQKTATNSTVKFDITERLIRLYKNAAVVTGLGTTRAIKDGKTRITGQFRFIHVWEKREGGWLLTVDQTTAVRALPPVQRISNVPAPSNAKPQK